MYFYAIINIIVSTGYIILFILSLILLLLSTVSVLVEYIRGFFVFREQRGATTAAPQTYVNPSPRHGAGTDPGGKTIPERAFGLHNNYYVNCQIAQLTACKGISRLFFTSRCITSHDPTCSCHHIAYHIMTSHDIA